MGTGVPIQCLQNIILLYLKSPMKGILLLLFLFEVFCYSNEYPGEYSFFEDEERINSLAKKRHLYPGYQYPGWVNSSDYSYFYTHISTLFKNLDDDDIITLYVTPLSGKVDVYAGRFTDYPSETFCRNNDNCYVSKNGLSDIITFKKNDHPMTNSTSDYFRVTVFCPKDGLSNDYLSEFSISIVTTKIELFFLNGIPQLIQYNPGFNETFYYYQNYFNNSMTYSLLPLSGVSVSASEDKPGPSTPKDKVYESEAGYSNDIIVAKSSDPQYIAKTTWYGSVVAESSKEQKFLYVTNWVDEYNYTILLESIPVISTVENGKWKYFLIRVPSMDTRQLVIQISPVYRKLFPDVYINTPNVNFYPFPNKSNFNMRITGAQSLDGEYVIKNPINGWWKIGVFGVSRKQTEFAIFFVTETDIIELSDQMEPLSITLPKNTVKYFKYHNVKNVNSIHFNVETISGDVTGYLSLPKSHYSRPTKQHHDLEFKNLDKFYYYIFPAVSEVGDYYFSIFSNKDEDAECMVSVALENKHAVLENDVPIYYDEAQKGSYRYYVFYANPSLKSSVSISVFSNTSDVDVYVSTTDAFPDDTHKTWSATTWGNEIVTITPDDPGIKSNNFFIGVYGYGNPTVFSIVAYTSSTPIPLYEDQIVDGQLKKGVHEQFSFLVNQYGKTLTVTLTHYKPSSEGEEGENKTCELKCYANYNSMNPSKTKHEYASVNKGKTEEIAISRARSGTYYIEVEQENCDPSVPQDFDIFVHLQ